MQNAMIGLLAETFIHPGIGQNEGAIDLPVAREAATDFPFIPGSSFKGALKDHADSNGLEEGGEKHKKIFGLHDNAGGLLVSDARLLLLPVRSLSGCYKWITCGQLLERFRRDLERGGLKSCWPDQVVPEPAEGEIIGKGEGTLFLEERNFCFAVSEIPEVTLKALQPLMKSEEAGARLADQLVILHSEDFAWFARYGLAVQTRNVLNRETKESENVWTEETLPPDTLMYSLLGERNADNPVATIKELIEKRPYIQVGGNETVGQGWFAMKCLP